MRTHFPSHPFCFAGRCRRGVWRRLNPRSPPAGVAFPDSGGVRAALLGATRIGYSTGPSGNALVQAIEDWGLTGEVGDRLVQARPGVPVAQLLADGEVDLGFQQLSELVGQPGIRILGVLPPDCEIVTVFGGAVATTSTDREPARSILDFLASSEVARIKTEHNFGAPAGRDDIRHAEAAMDLGLKDRVYLIGGGSKGLGFATARALVDDGSKVVIVSRDAANVDRAIDSLGRESATGLVADVADQATASAAVDRAITAFGRLDGALINTGGPRAASVSESMTVTSPTQPTRR